jgi:hypothetical protein
MRAPAGRSVEGEIKGCSVEFLCVFLCVLCAFARNKELRAKAQRTQRNTRRINSLAGNPCAT